MDTESNQSLRMIENTQAETRQLGRMMEGNFETKGGAQYLTSQDIAHHAGDNFESCHETEGCGAQA